MQRTDVGNWDAIVVGSGAAGSLMAAELAEAGRRVLILEAGPPRELSSLVSSQVHARALKWHGAPVEEAGNLPIGHGFAAGFGTGGSALHHYGVWLRLHEADFNVRSQYDLSLDWPITYRDLQPAYDAVQDLVGISGDAKAEVWRPAGTPYPMPAIPTFPQGQILAEGFSRLGMTTSALPLAINSVPREGRQACQYDGWCDAGCPIGALANPLVTHLQRARKLGAVLRCHAEVTRVLRDPNNPARAIGVEYRDQDGLHIIKAPLIVIAAFVVQTVRILLNSADGDKPAPGNEHDQLGRYLTTHPAGLVYGLFEEPTYPYQGVPGGQRLCQDAYTQKRQKNGGFGSYSWLLANSVKPNDLLGICHARPDLYGAKLSDFMSRAARHLANMTYLGEDISLPDNRVVLSQTKDRHGLPLARAIHNVGDATRQQHRAAIEQGAAIMSAAGATETWASPLASVHIMGGTVMGTHPDTSVTDHLGRLHQMDNLYIAGPSLFPSSGAVNPTFTLSALTYRAASAINNQPLSAAAV